MNTRKLNIVIPMAGAGTRFIQANYTFPKPLIDMNGKPMIQAVVENLRMNTPHQYIFICQKQHYEKYSLHEIFSLITHNNFECVQSSASTQQGAACAVLSAIDYINNDDELIVANSDQIVDINVNTFVQFCRKSQADGVIMTFDASHPKWSYAKVDKKGFVVEVAEKKVISNKATVGIYYFKKGKYFVENALRMINRDMRINNEFYVCPVYNEMILSGAKIKIWDIKSRQMHGLGTPEDFEKYLTETKNRE